jgi:hypothetical protein
MIYTHGTASFEMLLQWGTFNPASKRGSTPGYHGIDDGEASDFFTIQRNLYALCLNENIE